MNNLSQHSTNMDLSHNDVNNHIHNNSQMYANKVTEGTENSNIPQAQSQQQQPNRHQTQRGHFHSHNILSALSTVKEQESMHGLPSDIDIKILAISMILNSFDNNTINANNTNTTVNIDSENKNDGLDIDLQAGFGEYNENDWNLILFHPKCDNYNYNINLVKMDKQQVMMYQELVHVQQVHLHISGGGSDSNSFSNINNGSIAAPLQRMSIMSKSASEMTGLPPRKSSFTSSYAAANLGKIKIKRPQSATTSQGKAKDMIAQMNSGSGSGGNKNQNQNSNNNQNQNQNYNQSQNRQNGNVSRSNGNGNDIMMKLMQN